MTSERYLFALRIAISVVIAAGVSLWLGWERPMWAMFGVIYPALGQSGESLHKGMMRVGATFLGGGLSLLFTAMFNDERWMFGGAVLVWIMFATFMMQNNRHWYFWFHSCVLVVLMPIYSAGQPAAAFEVVMLRLQETLLGVTIYTLVANILLPDGRRGELIRDLRDQVAAVGTAFAHLADAYRRDAPELADEATISQLRAEAVALHTSFRTRIDAGITESFDLVENRDAWMRVIGDLEAIISLLNRLRLSLGDIKPGRLGEEVPELLQISDEISRRLDETAAVLGGATGVELPHELDICRIARAGSSRDVFGTGALVACLEILRDIDRCSADLLNTAAEARGLTGRRPKLTPARAPLPRTVIPEPDTIAAVVRIWATFSLAFLLFIFLPDLPSGASVMLLSAIIGAFVSTKPTISTRPVQILGTLIIVVAGFMHVIIMPKLTSFWGLGTMLFIYMFIGAALLSSARAAPLRFIALGFAVMIFQITPDQEYSFLYVANMVVSYQIPFILLWITQVFPISFRPEAVFQRLLRRYMNSFEHLLGEMQYDHRSRHKGWWDRQIGVWHLRNLMLVPDRLGTWIGVMPKAAMTDEDRKSAMALAQALNDVSGRMAGFARMHDIRYSPETVERLRPTIRAWREALERLSRNFRQAPDALPPAGQLTGQLEAHLDKVRAETRMALNDRPENAGMTEAPVLARELAAYRGLSEALIRATAHASGLNWAQLREPRL